MLPRGLTILSMWHMTCNKCLLSVVFYRYLSIRPTQPRFAAAANVYFLPRNEHSNRSSLPGTQLNRRPSRGPVHAWPLAWQVVHRPLQVLSCLAKFFVIISHRQCRHLLEITLRPGWCVCPLQRKKSPFSTHMP